MGASGSVVEGKGRELEGAARFDGCEGGGGRGKKVGN